MDRTILLTYLRDLFAEYDSTIPTDVGTAVYNKIISPLLERFGDDIYAPDMKEFVLAILKSEFPESDYTELDPSADVVVNPLKVIVEPLRRELLRLRMAQSLTYKAFLTDEEIEGLVSVFQVLRKNGTKAAVSVRIYFRAPRIVDVGLGVSAYTASGLTYVPIQPEKFTSQQLAQNREGDYFYVDVNFQAVQEGSEYTISDRKIIGVNGITGAVYATNISSSSPGEDRETISEYLDRITSWVSEHAPVTKSGVMSRIMELFPQITDIFVVGNGDDWMYRDVISYEAQTSATIATGHGTGTLEAWTPGSGVPTTPYALEITGDFSEVVPPLAVYTPTVIVINGVEYSILNMSDDSIVPVSFDYQASSWGTEGTTDVFYTAPNEVVIPHRFGFSDALGGEGDLHNAQAGDLLLIWNGVSYDEYPVLGVADTAGLHLLMLKGPAEIIKESFNVDPFSIDCRVSNFGELMIFRSKIGDTYIDFLGSKPVEVGDHLVCYDFGMAWYEYVVTYVGSTYLIVDYAPGTVDPMAPPPVAGASGNVDSYDSSTRTVEDLDVDFHMAAVGDGDSFCDADARAAAVIEGVDQHHVVLEEASFVHTGPILAGQAYSIYEDNIYVTVSSWVIFRRADGDYSDDMPSLNNLSYVLIHNPGELLAPGDATWQTRRAAVSSDFSLTLSLPDGTMEASSGDPVHLGGCTDVYAHTSETPSNAKFDTLSDLLPIMRFSAAWNSGEDFLTITDLEFIWENIDQLEIINIPSGTDTGGPGSIMRNLFVTIATTPKKVLRVLALPEEGVLRVDYTFTDSGSGVYCEISGQPRVDMHSGMSIKVPVTYGAQVGFSKFVILPEAVPESVSPGDTFEITSGSGKGVYEIESIYSGGLVLGLKSTVEAFGVSVPYRVYSYGGGVDVPLSRVERVDLLSESGSVVDSLYYGLPLACRVLSDSVTDGPDTIIPPGESGGVGDYMCSVANFPDAPALMGVMAWSGNAQDMGVRVGNVLILRGELNTYSARITSVDYSFDDEVTYITFLSYSLTSPVRDEDDVPFEVHSAQVATVRMYFENPVHANYGAVSYAFRTEFLSGNYRYVSHPNASSLIELPTRDTKFEIDASGGDTHEVTTASDEIDFDRLGVKAGDLVNLNYGAICGSPISVEVDVAGKSITAEIAGSRKTMYFSGVNPLSVDSDDGVSGQLESSFGVDVDVELISDGVVRIRIVSPQKVTFIEGSALTDLGFVPGVSNDFLPESIKGTHLVVRAYRTTIETDTVFTTSALGDGSIVGEIVKIGDIELAAEEMSSNSEFGFYYADVEVVSTQDAAGSKLHANDYLEIAGLYFFEGFWIHTRQEYSFGASEVPYLHLFPLSYDASGDPIPVLAAGMNIYYRGAPTIEDVQDVLSSDSVRATADNLMAKQKPLLEIGVGPLTYSGDVDQVRGTARERIRSRAKELSDAGSSVTLSDVLAALSPLGISYVQGAQLIWKFESLNRRRSLRFGDSVTIERSYRIEAPEELLIFQE